MRSQLWVRINAKGICMTLIQIIEALPKNARHEVRDFAEYLLHKAGVRQRGIPSFRWAGILADEASQHSSVELQHKMLSSRLAAQ
jgi:hypothetical protein